MSPKNAMEIFQLLDKSNCRECGEKTCLAFAGAVFTGKRKLSECPHLDREIVGRYNDETGNNNTMEQNGDEFLEALRSQVMAHDLEQAAKRIGARFTDGKLTLKVLGKDFSVDTQGNLSADIHINPWIAVPFINYVLHSEGRPVAGQWRSFRELHDGKERYPLFVKRCEEPMKQVADSYTELFDDLVHIFNGRQVEKQFKSDISVVLHPLPLVPLMVCYWRPDDGLASSLNIFFDESANHNLDNGSLFSIGAGLTQMFGKLALRHGF